MKRVWLFDLDDTLHDASSASLPGLHRSFGEYIQQHLGLTKEESDALRRRYWLRYGATLLGLRHRRQAGHRCGQSRHVQAASFHGGLQESGEMVH